MTTASDEDDDEDGDDEDQDDDAYSDDEDMSWKCRKASSRLLGTLISQKSGSIAGFIQNVAPVLISRFNERFVGLCRFG